MEEIAVVAKPKEWWNTSIEFWRDTNSEMKKVTWPGREEVVGTTIVVLIATFIFGVYLWGCDVVFYKAIDYLFSHFGSGVGS
jgi:preprotein translocase subunit SecE